MFSGIELGGAYDSDLGSHASRFRRGTELGKVVKSSWLVENSHYNGLTSLTFAGWLVRYPDVRQILC